MHRARFDVGRSSFDPNSRARTERPKAGARKTREVSSATSGERGLQSGAGNIGRRKRSKRKGTAPGGQEITSPDVRSFGFRALSVTQGLERSCLGLPWLGLAWLAPSQAKEKRHGKAERKHESDKKRIDLRGRERQRR